jgi:HEAT repeat protein
MLWWTLRQLNSRNEDTRRRAIDKLGESKGPHVVAALIGALKNREWNVRMGAAWGLWKQGNTQAVGPLVAALKDDDWRVRRTAATALGNFGDVRAAGPLVEATGDENSGVRERAASALAKINDPRMVQPLVAALGDADLDVRMAVVQALAGFGVAAKGATPGLVAMLDDNDRSLREAAEAALASIGAHQELAAFRARKEAAAEFCPQCRKPLRSEEVTPFVQARVCDCCSWAGIWCYQCKKSAMIATPEVWPDPQMPVQAWLECEACRKRGRADDRILRWLKGHGLL